MDLDVCLIEWYQGISVEVLPNSSHVLAQGHHIRHPYYHIFTVALEQQACLFNVSKGAKIRNRYNQVPYLTQDTNGKVTKSQLDTTNERKEASPFPAGEHKAHINRRPQRHSTHKTEKNIQVSPGQWSVCATCTRPSAQSLLPQGQQTYLILHIFD